MPRNLHEMLNQVPDEQRQLLERMMELGLVQSFANTAQGRWAVVYTARGRDFLRLVGQAIASRDPEHRLARLVALDTLADGEGVFGGFAKE